MKKTILITLTLILFLTTGMLTAEEKLVKKEERGVIVKSYTLKHISPEEVRYTLRDYCGRVSYGSSSMITVRMYKNQVTKFEQMLKKLDVEPKRILLRIFTVIASLSGKSTPIDNPDLRKVLTELKKVLSFKSFHLDGVSALNVMDGQSKCELRLSSQSSLVLSLKKIRVQKGDNGEAVKFGYELQQKAPVIGNQWETLVKSETSVKIGGYLVAGVSKIGKNGDSLVLVINAQLQ